MISCFIEGDALLPLYRIKRKSILGLKIYVVIGGFSLLADALLQGSCTNEGERALGALDGTLQHIPQCINHYYSGTAAALVILRALH